MTAPFFTDWMISILNTWSFIIVGIPFDSIATCGVNIESVTELYRLYFVYLSGIQLFPVHSHTSKLSHYLPPLAAVRMIFIKSHLRWCPVLQVPHVVTEVLCPQLIPSQGTFPSGFCSLPPRVGCPSPRSSFQWSYSWQGCGEAENPQSLLSRRTGVLSWTTCLPLPGPEMESSFFVLLLVNTSSPSSLGHYSPDFWFWIFLYQDGFQNIFAYLFPSSLGFFPTLLMLILYSFHFLKSQAHLPSSPTMFRPYFL